MSKFWLSNDDSSSSSDDSGEDTSSRGYLVDDMDENYTERSDGAKDVESSHETLSSVTPDSTWNTIRHQQSFQPPPQSTNIKPPNCTRIVCISDTHGRHRKISHLPAGDALVHAGDFTLQGELKTIEDLSDYFSELSGSFPEIVAIAGNHDRTLHLQHYMKHPVEESSENDCTRAAEAIHRHCTYLEDSSHKLESGLQMYGSPWTPEFCEWAFMLDRGKNIRQKWQQIPTSADVLITHGPPLGRGDRVPNTGHVGCFDLMREIQDRIRPRVNIFGHIHEGYGTTFDGKTLYVNASSVDIRYFPIHFPIVIDVPYDRSKPAMVVPPSDNGMNLLDIPKLCDSNGWTSLKASLDECDLERLMVRQGNDSTLLEDGTFLLLSESLRLERKGQIELAQALRAVHARSFPS